MHERKSSSSLFLMELIIVLFFFLLTAAICIQVFARAHSISRSSLELSHAQSLCASAAEVFFRHGWKCRSLSGKISRRNNGRTGS